jgi:hypothetical protein
MVCGFQNKVVDSQLFVCFDICLPGCVFFILFNVLYLCIFIPVSGLHSQIIVPRYIKSILVLSLYLQAQYLPFSDFHHTLPLFLLDVPVIMEYFKQCCSVGMLQSVVHLVTWL